mmetsp:Transcript_14375/g.23404  ORF Transcript_14375/g.23404 Transcript_14375/m.23404 type:complete len:282 (+) Transcript_14375:92-937(+)
MVRSTAALVAAACAMGGANAETSYTSMVEGSNATSIIVDAAKSTSVKVNCVDQTTISFTASGPGEGDYSNDPKKLMVSTVGDLLKIQIAPNWEGAPATSFTLNVPNCTQLTLGASNNAVVTATAGNLTSLVASGSNNANVEVTANVVDDLKTTASNSAYVKATCEPKVVSNAGGSDSSQVCVEGKLASLSQINQVSSSGHAAVEFYNSGDAASSPQAGSLSASDSSSVTFVNIKVSDAQTNGNIVTDATEANVCNGKSNAGSLVSTFTLSSLLLVLAAFVN